VVGNSVANAKIKAQTAWRESDWTFADEASSRTLTNEPKTNLKRAKSLRLRCSAKFQTTLTPSVADDKNSSNNFWRGSLQVHTSVIKRHKQSVKRRLRNIEAKSSLRTLIKKTRQAIESKNQADVTSQLKEVSKALGKAASKGLIKKNTASRWLSRLSRSAAKQVPAS
jgi:small subunit ribosomal protein S20